MPYYIIRKLSKSYQYKKFKMLYLSHFNVGGVFFPKLKILMIVAEQAFMKIVKATDSYLYSIIIC